MQTGTRAPRRRHADELKARVLAACAEPGASVAAVHGNADARRCTQPRRALHPRACRRRWHRQTLHGPRHGSSPCPHHERPFPYKLLSSIVRALKPGGQLVFVKYRSEDPQVPIKALHKMSEAQIKREAAAHALVWDRTVGSLPWQHLVVFRKRN